MKLSPGNSPLLLPLVLVAVVVAVCYGCRNWNKQTCGTVWQGELFPRNIPLGFFLIRISF